MFQGSCDVWDKTAAIGIPGEGRKLRSQGASVGPLWSREEVALIAARCNCVSHTCDIILYNIITYIYYTHIISNIIILHYTLMNIYLYVWYSYAGIRGNIFWEKRLFWCESWLSQTNSGEFRWNRLRGVVLATNTVCATSMLARVHLKNSRETKG